MLLPFRLVTFMCSYTQRQRDGRRDIEYILFPLGNVGLYLSPSWFASCRIATIQYTPTFCTQRE
jgi:hypothetical protein